MKKIYFQLIFTLLTSLTYGQWSKLNPLTTNTLLSIDFVNASKGFAVGSDGIILMTTDSGITWSSQQSGTTMQLSTVYFLNDSVGIIAAGGPDGGIILRTSDGGVNWSTRFHSTGNWFSDISFDDDNTGFVIGDCYSLSGAAQVILKTVDGGISWEAMLSPVNSGLNGCYFLDSNTGYAVGHAGYLIKTTNGGVNWEISHPSGSSFYLFDIFFTSFTTGYISGAAGTIMKTTDSGATWSVVPTGISNDLVSINFISESNGYIVGSNGVILMTNDAGSSWQRSESGTKENLFSVVFTDTETGYTAGRNGTILKTTNEGALSIEEKNAPASNFTNFPNPDVGRMYITNNKAWSDEIIVSIISIEGIQVFKKAFYNQNPINLDLDLLQKGIYLVVIQTKEGIETQKLVIQNN